MSSTRHAKPGSPFRQDKYSSSAEFEKGLLANLVARRCSLLESAEERELIWFLQLLSHREGGLEKVAEELAERFAERAGTSEMLRLGTKPGQIYNREQVESVRARLPMQFYDDFPLQGETKHGADEWNEEDILKKGNHQPASYPAKTFVEICRAGFSNLSEDLKVLCLRPSKSLEVESPWYFAALPDCLKEYHRHWIEAHCSAVVTTELGQKVNDALDYALESKCMILAEGNARTGKTFSAEAWCEQHPGRARYVQVPCTNDEIGFYRAIAKALGISSSLSLKSFELRERIEAVLQTGDIAIVFDEAHYLWPNLIDPRTLPARINWIMTALVNFGVPVGLIATPQFLKTQKVFESKTRWTSEQFTGRLYHYESLPEIISKEDLAKVARALLPEGDGASIEALVCYANTSTKYLAGIKAVVLRARYLAKRLGREKVIRADIAQAIKESVIPSDTAIAQSLAEPRKTSGKRPAMPLQAPLRADSEGLNNRAGSALDTFAETSGETNRTRLDLTPKG